MKINIVYSNDGWILERCAKEILKGIPEASGYLCSDMSIYEKNGVLNSKEKCINYYINYETFRGIKSINTDIIFMTHPKDKRFIQYAQLSNYVTTMTPQYSRFLKEHNIDSTWILPGVSEIFKPKLILGFCGRLTGPVNHKRKGGDFLDRIEKELDFVKLKRTNGKLKEYELPDFYGSCDYILSTATIEGGPMCLIESLACGKKIIIPATVGQAELFKNYIIDYEVGNWNSLISVLKNLYNEKLEISKSVKNYTWKNWVKEHIEVFKKYK